MSDNNRNFRSTYYDKVGFRCVEEKKSLEILLNERPIDRAKLSKFCLRFSLPSMYREYVWQVLLDVVSVNSESDDSIMIQRTEHFHETKEALEVMHKINEETPKPIVYTMMFLITQGQLGFNSTQQLKEPYAQNLTALASLFSKLSTYEVISYWLFRNFVLFIKKINVQYHVLKEQLESILKKEDGDLNSHLKVIKAFEILPTDLWFERYFADILYHSSLVRVLDKVIGGNCRILPFVGAAILIVRRHLLLSIVTEYKAEEIIKFLRNIPEDTSDVIVNKALDLYYS